MFKSVLIPVDFSEGSETAIELAKLVAPEGTQQFLHVVAQQDYSQLPYMSAQLAFGKEVHDRVLETANVEMAGLVKKRVEAGEPEHAGVVRTGSVPDTIADYAKEEANDLLVMATHGRTGLSRWLMGSVTERVLRVAPCPVLVARSTSVKKAPVLNRILIAIDFSEHSRRALMLSAKIAARVGASIECVHVWSSPYVGYSPVVMTDILDKLASSANEQLAKFVTDADLPSSVEVKQTVLSGAPAAALLDAMNQNVPDLLVLGTHGYGGIKRLVLGSVAEVTVRYSPCSTLVVP